jgi:hypothetical protein
MCEPVRIYAKFPPGCSQRQDQNHPAMLTAIAVPFELIPLELIRPHKLAQQIHVYDDWPEFRFHFGSADVLLPIVHECGRLTLARWGCRREECCVLPATGWDQGRQDRVGLLARSRR